MRISILNYISMRFSEQMCNTFVSDICNRMVNNCIDFSSVSIWGTVESTVNFFLRAGTGTDD